MLWPNDQSHSNTAHIYDMLLCQIRKLAYLEGFSDHDNRTCMTERQLYLVIISKLLIIFALFGQSPRIGFFERFHDDNL